MKGQPVRVLQEDGEVAHLCPCDRDTFKGRGRRGTDPGFSTDVEVSSDDDNSIMPL